MDNQNDFRMVFRNLCFFSHFSLTTDNTELDAKRAAGETAASMRALLATTEERMDRLRSRRRRPIRLANHEEYKTSKNNVPP